MEKVNSNAVTVVGVAERKVKMKKVVSAICSAALAKYPYTYFQTSNRAGLFIAHLQIIW